MADELDDMTGFSFTGDMQDTHTTDPDRVICIDVLQPVIEALRRKGVQAHSIIAALAQLSIYTIDQQRRN